MAKYRHDLRNSNNRERVVVITEPQKPKSVRLDHIWVSFQGCSLVQLIRSFTMISVISLCVLTTIGQVAFSPPERNVFRIFGAFDALMKMNDEFQRQFFDVKPIEIPKTINTIENVLFAAETEYGKEHIALAVVHLQLAQLKFLKVAKP